MIAYVQTTVAENLHPCRTTSRLLFKENRSTEAAVCSAVGDQRCSIGRRGLVEDRLPAGCTANSRSIVNERTVTGACESLWALGNIPNSVTPPSAPLAVAGLLIKVPFPAVEVLRKIVLPPPSANTPPAAPPLLIKMPLPAVELSSKSVKPPNPPLIVAPLLIKVPLAAVELSTKIALPPSAKLAALPSLIKVPLAAVELSRKSVLPLPVLKAVPPLLVKLPLPADEESWKVVLPP